MTLLDKIFILGFICGGALVGMLLHAYMLGKQRRRHSRMQDKLISKIQKLEYEEGYSYSAQTKGRAEVQNPSLN